MHARWVKRWDSKALGIERHVFLTEPISAGPGNRNGLIGNVLCDFAHCIIWCLVFLSRLYVYIVSGDSMLATGASGSFLNPALRALYSGKMEKAKHT